MLPNISTWTLFQLERSFWNISGIQDLENNSEIERPAVIVPSFWVKGNPYARTLKIYGDCVENCPVSESLIKKPLEPTIPVSQAVKLIEEVLPNHIVQRSWSLGPQRMCQELNRVLLKLRSMQDSHKFDRE